MNNNEEKELITTEELQNLKKLIEEIDPENKVFGKTKEFIKEKEEQDKNKGMNK